MAGRIKEWGCKKDGNHNDVVKWFQNLLCKVKEVHMVPKFVDLVVKCGNRIALVEVKDPSQFPSDRKLTEDEAQFWVEWGEDPVIVETQQDAIDLAQKLRKAGL